MKNQNDDEHNEQILQNLAAIHRRIDEACSRSGRDKDDVRLMLVTKTVRAPIIRNVMDHGENLIGENLIDEMEQKIEGLKSVGLPEVHFIGQLKEPEMDRIAAIADCIQTIDNYNEAFVLNEKLQNLNKNMDILIQVNTSRRNSPHGISPAHTIGLVLQISRMENLRIKGLMTLGLFECLPEQARECFRLLRNLYEELILLKIPRVEMDVLSMGMSDHLEIAIEEGSNMVRIGTAIFGERETSDRFYWPE